MKISNDISMQASGGALSASTVGRTDAAKAAEEGAQALKGPGVTMMDGVRNSESVATTEEVERDMVRDDDLGRAVTAAFCYNTPKMPDFSALE